MQLTIDGLCANAIPMSSCRDKHTGIWLDLTDMTTHPCTTAIGGLVDQS
jgi:hypothetical protein